MRLGNVLLVALVGEALYIIMALLRAAACRREPELVDEAPAFMQRARTAALLAGATFALWLLWRAFF